MEIRLNFVGIDKKEKGKKHERKKNRGFVWSGSHPRTANNIRVRALNIPNTDTFISQHFRPGEISSSRKLSGSATAKNKPKHDRVSYRPQPLRKLLLRTERRLAEKREHPQLNFQVYQFRVINSSRALLAPILHSHFTFPQEGRIWKEDKMG